MTQRIYGWSLNLNREDFETLKTDPDYLNLQTHVNLVSHNDKYYLELYNDSSLLKDSESLNGIMCLLFSINGFQVGALGYYYF